MNLPKEIFKAYDIRGIVGKTLTAGNRRGHRPRHRQRGRARSQSAICIGRDGRLSGPELAAALARGIQKAGIDVIDLGMVATPMTYFAAYELDTNSCVMVTGSHNPPDYNGLKMVLGGETLSGDTIQQLRVRLEQNNLSHGNKSGGNGSYKTHDIAEAYLSRIASDIKLARPMKIIVDCGNGVPGAFAPELYRRMGCTVEEMFCEVDGNFPNHHPDPSVLQNLEDLIARLKTSDAELGFAFDGDGDRLGVVTKDGSVIFPDRQLMLFADDVLSRNPGAEIIFDVKSTRKLFDWIRATRRQAHAVENRPQLHQGQDEGNRRAAGRRNVRPHVLQGTLVRLRRRPLCRRAPARISEQTGRPQRHPAQPARHRQHARTANQDEGRRALRADGNAAEDREVSRGRPEVITIDGLRVEYADGFGLARPSNTTPVIVLRFEADNEAALKRIQGEFRRVIGEQAAGLELPF